MGREAHPAPAEAERRTVRVAGVVKRYEHVPLLRETIEEYILLCGRFAGEKHLGSQDAGIEFETKFLEAYPMLRDVAEWADPRWGEAVQKKSVAAARAHVEAKLGGDLRAAFAELIEQPEKFDALPDEARPKIAQA